MDQKSVWVKASESNGIAMIENVLMNEITDISCVLDAIDFMSDSEVDQFFSKICSFATTTVSTLCDDDESFSDDEDKQKDFSKLSEEVNKLKKISAILSKYMKISRINPTGLFETTEVLHNILIPLDETIPGALALKASIAQICESCWVTEVAGAENLITQLIPYLLIAALKPSAHDADVKRLYSIRTALHLLDFDDPSIESIRSLVLRCFIHPAFLRVAEGRRFLSFLFTVHEGLNCLIVEVMKPQIAIGSKGVAAAYGEVLFRAWKDTPTSEGIAVTMESMEDALQGLFHDAIHAADQKYFRGLRIVLGSFHEAKRLKGVDSVLLRTYGPILWRSLRCANALVRAQATMLFFDAFPLQDSETSAVESDAILQKQFDLLSSLLKDADHRVRAAAASGVCHILREYWEALPSQTTRQILSYVVGTLGHDSSCATVRLAVVTGLGEVLDQPLAHTVLKGLLPLMANALHDKAPAVRLAFIGVLNKVKNTRGLHFCQIVSVEQLQRRLAEDANRPAVCASMTELLLNSYYPQQALGPGVANNQSQVQRCLQFIQENEMASIAFYGNFHKLTSIGSASKMVVMLLALFTKPDYFKKNAQSSSSSSSSYLIEGSSTAVVAKGKRSREDKSIAVGDMPQQHTEENVSEVGEGLSEKALKVAVLRVMLACLSSVSSSLIRPEHAPSRDLLLKYFTPETVQKVFTSLLSTPACEEEEDSNEESEGPTDAIPLFLRIVLIVTKSRGDEEGMESPEREIGITAEMVLTEFNTAWRQSSPSSSSAVSHAGATAEILLALKEEDMLLQTIQRSLKHLLSSTGQGSDSIKPLEICSSPEPFNPLKGRGGKRKPQNASSPGHHPGGSHTSGGESSLVPLAAAVELLAVLVAKESSEGLRVDEVFSTVRSVIDVLSGPEKRNKLVLQMIEEQGNAAELVRCVHLWALHVLQLTAALKANSLLETNSELQASPMEELLSWVTGVLLPFCCRTRSDSSVLKEKGLEMFSSPAQKVPPRSRSRKGATPNAKTGISCTDEGISNMSTAVALVISIVDTVLLVLSDCLLLSVASDELCTSILTIVEEISEHESEGREVSMALTPVFGRIQSLLSASPGAQRLQQRTRESLSLLLDLSNNKVISDTDSNIADKENADSQHGQTAIVMPSPSIQKPTSTPSKLVPNPDPNTPLSSLERDILRLEL